MELLYANEPFYYYTLRRFLFFGRYAEVVFSESGLLAQRICCAVRVASAPLVCEIVQRSHGRSKQASGRASEEAKTVRGVKVELRG